MKNFYTYDSEGRIHNAGTCADDDYTLQGAGGLLVAEGEANRFAHYRDGSELKVLPPKTSERHVFNYQSKQWVDPRTLPEHQAAQWEVIKAARAVAEFGGFKWDGSTFDSDSVSQGRIQGGVQLAGLVPGFLIDWTLTDNTVRNLSASDMVNVGVALAQHVGFQHAKARALRQQINAANSLQEIISIVW